MSEVTARPSLLVRAGHWVAELLLVFIGVSAAFWLNNYQQHQQDVLRRDQILATLERQLTEDIESGNTESGKRQTVAFERALDAGEMPEIRPYVFITDYDSSDVSTLLESGGVLLLDPKTLGALKNLQSVIRGGLANLSRYQKLSDELIVPNLGQPKSFFYHTATRRLRERYEFFSEALQATLKFHRDLKAAQTALLKRIQAERRR